MLILKFIIFIAAVIAVMLLLLHQMITQVKEYAFYRDNGWDFSVDSGFDRIDERISIYRLPLTNWQRLYIFRPFYIAMLVWFLGLMILGPFL